MNAPSTPSTPPAPRVVMLAALDATASAEHVLHMAVNLAQVGSGAELHFLHVVEVLPRDSGLDATFPTATNVLEDARRMLDKQIATAHERFQGRIVGHLAAGTPWREIVQLASDLEADCIVVGTNGKTGVARFVLGSVAEQVVRHGQCPVLVARPKNYATRDVPEIEPPCPDCVEARRATAGAAIWCTRHATHHVHGRLHYEHPKGYGAGSMLFRG